MAAIWEKIVAFFMSIIAFFAGLFGFGGAQLENSKVFEDVSYGSHERNVLDLYIPEDASGDLGLVLYIHGGAWVSGDKEAYEGTAQYASEGIKIAGAAMNYRYLSDSTTMEDIIDDIDAALKKIKAIGAENGVNINKVILGGHSAGGHLSMLYAYSRKDTAPITPVAVIDQSGPTDMNDDAFFSSTNVLGTEYLEQLISWSIGKKVTVEDKDEYINEIRLISPLYYVDKDTVPTLICHGDHDTVVPYSNAVSLDAKLTQYGVKHDFITYNADHDLKDEAAEDKAYEIMIKYVNSYLK